MAYIKIPSTQLDKYLLQQMKGCMNIILVLQLLEIGDKKIPEIGEYLNNNSFGSEKSDPYPIVDRLQCNGYILIVKDRVKYKSKKQFCTLTEKAKTEMPDILKVLKKIKEQIDFASVVLNNSKEKEN